ncbi:hypothetical protein BJV77DRAFT_1065119 [Russula vinacea]|nr:hypothetical protein BJV77DRAFT_1065119 [Russula vinacea]
MVRLSTNPCPPRRRPYFRLEQTVASSSTSRPLHPYSSRARVHPQPLRAQVASGLPALPMPGLEPSTLSPSDPGSPMSTAAPPTPAPEFLHVVCNAPLLAPKPLPYRPPAFLDNFELPDPDEDLSHPPYTRSSSKRKRTQDGQDDLAATSFSKRRASGTPWTYIRAEPVTAVRSGEDPHNLADLTPEFEAMRARRKRMPLSDGLVRAAPHYVVNSSPTNASLGMIWKFSKVPTR